MIASLTLTPIGGPLASTIVGPPAVPQMMPAASSAFFQTTRWADPSPDFDGKHRAHRQILARNSKPWPGLPPSPRCWKDQNIATGQACRPSRRVLQEWLKSEESMHAGPVASLWSRLPSIPLEAERQLIGDVSNVDRGVTIECAASPSTLRQEGADGWMPPETIPPTSPVGRAAAQPGASSRLSARLAKTVISILSRHPTRRDDAEGGSEPESGSELGAKAHSERSRWTVLWRSTWRRSKSSGTRQSDAELDPQSSWDGYADRERERCSQGFASTGQEFAHVVMAEDSIGPDERDREEPGRYGVDDVGNDVDDEPEDDGEEDEDAWWG